MSVDANKVLWGYFSVYGKRVCVCVCVRAACVRMCVRVRVRVCVCVHACASVVYVFNNKPSYCVSM